jgi:hypothetical protein
VGAAAVLALVVLAVAVAAAVVNYRFRVLTRRLR